MVQSGQFSFDDARTAFDIADINGDGEIDIGQYQLLQNYLNIIQNYYLNSGEFVQLMFPNAAEIVSQVWAILKYFMEYLNFTFLQLKRNFNSIDDVVKMFKSWDLDGDGAISFTELQVRIEKLLRVEKS